MEASLIGQAASPAEPDEFVPSTKRFYYDEADDVAVIRTTQDVEPILDRNKAAQNEGERRICGEMELRHVASIPAVIMLKWFNEEGAPVWRMNGEEFAAFIRRKLNDPDYRWLKATPMQV